MFRTRCQTGEVSRPSPGEAVDRSGRSRGRRWYKKARALGQTVELGGWRIEFQRRQGKETIGLDLMALAVQALLQLQPLLEQPAVTLHYVYYD